VEDFENIFKIQPETIDSVLIYAINIPIRQINYRIFKENEMKLSPPKQITYWISVAIAVLGVLVQAGILATFPVSSFALVLIAFIVLALSLLIKGV
jgi:hypothetical protein